MARIIDYSYLLQQTFGIAGVSGGNLLGSFRLSEIGSSSVQAQLKAAGIDTSSNQYKAAMREMQKNGNGAMFTNVQAIKNSMRCYDKDGDYIDPTTGQSTKAAGNGLFLFRRAVGMRCLSRQRRSSCGRMEF